MDLTFASAVAAGDVVYISGQPSWNMNTGEFLDGSFEEQFDRCFENLETVLMASNLTWDNVVKITVFLHDMRNYQEMNALYAKKFENGKYPARSCFGCSGLPLGAKVEIEMIAHRG